MSNCRMPGQTNLADDFPADLLVSLRPAASGGKAVRLTQELRSAILSGRLAAGTALPPSRVLAGELGVSRSVVVQAYGDLAADGHLEARQGSGTRVRLPPAAEAPARARRRSARPTQVLLERAPVRLLGGLPDPQLFPRTVWARHYRAALAELPDAELGYPDSRGAETLRTALCAYLGRVRGVVTTPEHVLVCGGVTQGVTLLCRALRRAGARRIATEEPGFHLHREAIAATGLEPVPVRVDEHGLDVARLGAVDAVLVAPAHSYPLGSTLSADRRRALIGWARRRGALVIEDDYDAELRYDRTPIGALQGHAPDHVAYLGSASKTLIPALRLGWIAAPPHLMDALDREKCLDDMGSSLTEQIALARFVARGDFARHLRHVRPVYRRRRDASRAALDALLPEARQQGAAAGLHLHLSLPADVDMRALRRGARERGLLVEDAAWHWADPRDAPPAIVFGYGTLVDSVARRAVASLAAAVRASRAQPG
jgi:GntR family transcriptional regulator / MocR family aminotransferase